MRDCPYKYKCTYYVGTPENKCYYWDRSRKKCRVEFGKYSEDRAKGKQSTLY